MNTLPKLPIPRLTDALGEFMSVAKPLLSKEEFARLKDICTSFANDAKEIDLRLRKYIDSLPGNANWLLDFWNKMYLSIRDSLLTQSNYGFHLSSFARENEDNFSFIANLILSTSCFYKKIFHEKLDVLNIGKHEFSLSLANNLLSCTRIPKKGLDEWINYPSFIRHIAIIYKQNIYLLEVFDEKGVLASKESVIKALSEIKQNQTKGKCFFPAGYFGSDKAVSFLAKLNENKANKANYDALNKTIFHLSLSDNNYHDYKDFFAQAIQNKSNNIWPYKPVNFIAYNNNEVSLHMEHTGADGLYTVYIIEQIIKLYKQDLNHKSSFHPKPKKLDFVLNEELSSIISKYEKDFDKIRQEYCAKVYSFDHNFLPFKQASADCVAQIMLQYAMAGLENTPRGIYSACSMNHFYCGRTEALYPQSAQIQDFVRILEKEKRFCKNTFELALNEHKRRIKLAKKGESFARYFSGLKWLCKDEKIDYFYESKGYKKMNENYFSTSTVGGIGGVVKHFFFTPPTPSTYGIGYLVSKEKIEFDVVYFKDNLKAKVFFARLDEMKEILSSLN